MIKISNENNLFAYGYCYLKFFLLRSNILNNIHFEYEKYLDFQGNFALRRNITKMRTSSHQLEIEAGRYNSKKSNKIRTEPKKRLCRNCNLGEVEDEEHAVMSCPKYEAVRKKILVTLTEAFPFLEYLSIHEKFIFIMHCHDWEVTDALSKILLAIQKERGSL